MIIIKNHTKKFYELIKGLQEKENKDYQEALEKWNQNNQTTPAPDQPNIEFKKILDAMKHGNFNDLLLDRSKADAYKLTLRNKNIPNLDTETILSKDTSEALGTLLNNKEMQKNIIQNNRNALNKNTKQGGSKGSGGNRSGLSGQKNQKNNNGYFGDDTKDSKKDKDEKKKKGLGGPIAWPDQSSSGHQPSQNYGGSNYNYGGGGRSGGGYRPSSGGYYG
ncbi:hypothetical protein EBU24_01685, partial [bacterium]|nr:hypothetical protein [bacterium]